MRIRLFALTLALAALVSGQAVHAQTQGSVANATFTANVADGAPVDFRQQFTNGTPVVYYYGELLDLAGQTVKMRWSLEGKSMQETSVASLRRWTSQLPSSAFSSFAAFSRRWASR